MEAAYNDIQEWKWKDLVAAFGAKEGKARTYQVKTKGEMEELLNSKDFCAASCLQVSRNTVFRRATLTERS